MAWALRTACQQCGEALKTADRKLGPICSACVRGNRGRVWGKDSDDDYTEGE